MNMYFTPAAFICSTRSSPPVPVISRPIPEESRVMASADLTVVVIPEALTPMAPRDRMKSRRETRLPMKASTRSRMASLRVLGGESIGECGRCRVLRKGRSATVSLLTGLTV